MDGILINLITMITERITMITVITRFDMDYTLCEYISPQFDALACSLAIDHLVEVGFNIIVVFVIAIMIMVIIHILLPGQDDITKFKSRSA